MGNAEPSMPAVVVADEGLTESMTPVRVDDGPSPKARGPAPPRPENPVIENLEGNTVHGVLLGSEDLESVLLDIQMSRAEGGEQLMRTLSYEGLNPGLDLDSIVIPHDRGVHEGKTITELRIMIQASNISDGAGFWSYIYFERLLQPESDMAAAALSDLPRASSEGRLRERDHLQDLLRWAIGRFARLRDVTGDLTNYLSTVSEMETSSKQRMEDLGMKILEMVNGIVGLSASVRHVSEETSKNHRAEVKENHVAGGNQVIQQTKNQEETNKLLLAMNDHLKKLIDIQGKKIEEPKSGSAASKYPPPPPNVAGSGGAGSTVPPAPLTPTVPVQPKFQYLLSQERRLDLERCLDLDRHFCSQQGA
ncbi:unnamed protein product [Durusdinium trenchii]|uniref:Uncharacterized protein n=1 Tax=Durusdinium trenchii TaxID=1381693 RepID=A0ABP0N683_9DINO